MTHAPPRCPAHADGALTPLLTGVEDRFWGFDGEFAYGRCTACGTWVLDPRPAPREMGPYYARYYNPAELATRRAAMAKGLNRSAPLEWARARDCLRRLARRGRRLGAADRVLDAGCGAGGFLASVHAQTGATVQGVDFDARCADFAGEVYGVPVDAGELSAPAYPADAFALVTSWHCLEHTYDPRAELREMARVLAPGGWLVLEVPHPGWFARLFRGRWLFLQAPTHLFHFRRAALTALVAEAGLTELSTRTPWLPTEVAGSALLSLGVKGFYRLLGPSGSIGDRLLKGLFFALLVVDLPLTALAAVFGGGGVLQVWARKPERG